MLCGSCAFGGWLLAIALVEAIDASRGIDQLLFAGEERVASRANFDVQVALLGRAGLERLAASAGNSYIDVFWVNSWFHLVTFYRRHAGRIFKQDMIGACAVGRQAWTGEDLITADYTDSVTDFSFDIWRRSAPKRHYQHIPEWFGLRTRGVFARDNNRSRQFRRQGSVGRVFWQRRSPSPSR